ncbi:MAG: zf-HC2 domain-containing protein [Deltaproteobacteria bacterium]|nr:zf-HC2 domain-containing protein [Deltaproteobacteria bacterium]
MNPHTNCPDFSLLSQFLDHELGEEETKKIGQHLETCPECQAQVGRIERAEGIVRAQLARSSAQLSLRAPAQECPSPEMVSAYVQHVLSAEDEGRVEKHLQTCDVCLNEVKEAFRHFSSLTSPKRKPVPTALKARIAALWESPPAKEQAVSFSRLVIQIAKRGLKLLEQHLVPPLLDVQEMLVPVPAYRAEEGPAVLNFRINAGQAAISATAVQEGNGVALRLTFLGTGQETLAGQRVFLRQQGRSIFSARTDDEGELRLPHLEPGLYEVTCPGIPAVFHLELRP